MSQRAHKFPKVELLPTTKAARTTILIELLNSGEANRRRRDTQNLCWMGVDAKKVTKACESLDMSGFHEDVIDALRDAKVALCGLAVTPPPAEPTSDLPEWNGPWKTKRKAQYRKYKRPAVMKRLIKASKSAQFIQFVELISDKLSALAINATARRGIYEFADLAVSPRELTKLQALATKKGFTLFAFDKRVKASNDTTWIAVCPTADVLEAIVAVGTTGSNSGIDTQQIAAWINEVGLPAGLQIDTICGDRICGRLTKALKSPKAFTEAVYAVCPDAVWQGTESLEKLEKNLRRSKYLFLWWD